MEVLICSVKFSLWLTGTHLILLVGNGFKITLTQCSGTLTVSGSVQLNLLMNVGLLATILYVLTNMPDPRASMQVFLADD